MTEETLILANQAVIMRVLQFMLQQGEWRNLLDAQNLAAALKKWSDKTDKVVQDALTPTRE